MNFDWRRVIILTLIALLLSCLVFVIAANAISEDEFNRLYGETVTAPFAESSTNASIQVYQMDTIYWGDQVDLSLVCGWYDKVYHEETGKIVDISAFQHRIIIDPEVFTTGWWMQWSPYDERAGNTYAFKVAEKRGAPSSNVSTVVTPNVTLKPYIQPIPVKKVTDILIARGDPLSINFKKAKLWIFGTKSGYYDFMTINNAITLNKTQIQNLEPGTYTLLAEFPNNKTAQFNMRYDQTKDRLEYFDPNQFKILYVELSGLDPTTRLAKFHSVRDFSQDSFVEYKMIVEDPKIEIVSLDQVYINDTTFAQTVKGYTNVALGSKLTFVIDREKIDRYNTFYTTAEGSGNPGEMRWFELTIPLLWDNFAAGHHTIEGTTEIGGSMNVDFNVYESPDHSFIPNNTIKYLNGSEWRPDPTPKIITEVVTKEIVKVVTKEIPVPPPQESVDAAQSKAINSLAVNVLILVGVCLGCIGGFVYWRSLSIRQREEQERWK